VAGDPANVRAPDRDVEGSPATPHSPTGGVARPGTSPVGAPPTTQQSWTLPLVTEWSAAPVHRRCLTDCHRQRWSDDCRIPRPVPGCDSTPWLCLQPQRRRPGRSPVRRRTRVAQAPSNGAGSFERNDPAPQFCSPFRERAELSPRAGAKIGRPIKIRCLQRER
jgi:hypothetical protein